MPRRSTAHISCREARDLYLIIGGCCALGGDGGAWRHHLAVKLRRLLEADVVCFADLVTTDPAGVAGECCRPVSLIDDGWKLEADRQAYWHTILSGWTQYPAIRLMLARDTPVQVGRRCDLISNDEWYGSALFREQIGPAGLEDFVVCINNGSNGEKQALIVHRAQGRDPFSRRVVHLLRALWIELRRRQPHELRPINGSALSTLPRRMLQVLACLLAGHTAQETADLLEVSVHTVQEHIRRLYKRSGTRNRSELAECYRHVAPSLMDMSLEEIPYRSKKAGSTDVKQ